MTDNIKDLLTRAAKGAGYNVYIVGEDFWLITETDTTVSTAKWQPHLDDGDSTRLADVVGMAIDHLSGVVTAPNIHVAELFTPRYPEERRMAVLRAAAES